MSKHPTIQDIARECGVSIGTVDRVLHQRGRFSAETEEKIREAIHRLNYVPRHSSPAFFSGESAYAIGVYYVQDDTPGSFWQQAAEGIALAETELNNQGIRIIRENPPSFNVHAQIKAFERLLSHNVNAILATAFDSGEEYNAFSVIPDHVFFATVINKAWNSRCLFHMGPNDEAMGALIAQLISLYCPHPARTVIIAPNIEIEGTHKRVQGFIGKMGMELSNKIRLLQIVPIVANSPEESLFLMEKETRRIIETYNELEAIYVTNAYSQPACDVISEMAPGRIRVFCHERFSGMESYFAGGRVTASIDQNPRLLWYNALMTMGRYLTTRQLPEKLITADCRLLTRETLPLINPPDL